jgi:hypothetical protein
MGERCLKLAPTGLAAYNIGGVTLDSLLTCYHYAKISTLERLEQTYDCIIIDEISMIHSFKMNQVFEIIESLYKRGKMIKLVLIGDPFQLPPVTPQNMILAFSRKEKRSLTTADFYFFRSHLFQRYYMDNMECFFLLKNHRQNDAIFGKILSKIAMGSADKSDLEYLNQQEVDPSQSLSIQDGPIVTPSRNGVRYFNELGLRQYDYRFIQNAVFEWRIPAFDDIENDCQDITDPITYSIKAPIIFTKKEPRFSLVNGTKGIIDSSNNSDSTQVSLNILTENRQIIQCQPVRHVLQRFIYDKHSESVKNECVAIVKQFPFILGFALSVHKCQGMTLEKMTFNPGRGCFAPGQLYVALSRVRNLKDLNLHIPLEKKDIIISRDVNNYFNDFKSRCIIVQ